MSSKLSAGTLQFINPSGQTHDSGLCEPQLNLLAHAQAIELDIGSRCGGHGVCGGDRVRIPQLLKKDSEDSEFSEITENERRHLTPEELAAGWRLACQCYPDKADQNIFIETR